MTCDAPRRSLPSDRSARGFALVVLVWPWIFFFVPVFWRGETLAFRDASRFHLPTLDWIWGECSRGELPLWSPRENLGVPLAAEISSGICYPGQLVFLVPGRFHQKYNAYVAGHCLLAVGTTYFVARRWRWSRAAACLSAVSYGYGAPVLFHYSNVIYLVSAAWLPVGIWAIDGCVRRQSFRAAVGLGVVAALMILGGDPQTSYHLGLATMLAWLCHIGHRRLRLRRCDARRIGGQALRLLTAGSTAFVLSCVVLLPGWDWVRASERATRVDDADSAVTSANEPEADTTGRYQFSVGPWRLAECVWPNYFGRMFPVHHRWGSAIPAESLVWNPSLYIGLAPLGLCLAAVRLRGGGSRRRWLSWLLLLAVLGSFGWYGFGWLVRELAYDLGLHDGAAHASDSRASSNPWGGIYWWLVQFAPGYGAFRYPGKWSVCAALPAALLAGLQVEAWYRSRKAVFRRRPPRLTALLLVAGTSALIMAFYAIEHFDHPNARIVDIVLGPLDRDGARADVVGAVIQFVLVGSVVTWLSCRPSNSLAVWSVVTLTACDLVLANNWLIQAVPASLIERASVVSQFVAPEVADGTTKHVPRVYRAPVAYTREEWRRVGAADRLEQSLAADIDTLYTRLTWRRQEAVPLALVESSGSIANADFQAVMRLARRPSRGGGHLDIDLLRFLATDYLLSPDADLKSVAALRAAAWTRVASIQGTWSLWRSPRLNPRAWLVTNVSTRSPISNSQAALERRTREVYLPDGRLRDFSREAVVEVDEFAGFEAPGAPVDQPTSPAPGPACRIVLDTPRRVDIEVHSDRAGLLVLADLYTADWRATIRPLDAAATDQAGHPSGPQPPSHLVTESAVYRTNRIMRGVIVPAGVHRVTFSYHPTSFYWGACISMIGWLSLLGFFVRRSLTGRPIRLPLRPRIWTARPGNRRSPEAVCLVRADCRRSDP